jgi:hypothetical protein
VWQPGLCDQLAVLALVAACADERHVLVTNPSWPNNSSVGAWLRGLSGPVAFAVEGVLRFSASAYALNSSSGAARIVVQPTGCRWNETRVGVTQAVRLLQRPLKLLLENRRNDLEFLRRMAPTAERPQLDQARQNGWLEAEMGGGVSEIRKRLEALRNPADDQRWIELARLWVLFDRDANPKDRREPGLVSAEVLRIASSMRVPWPLAAHQLERRTVENYVCSTGLRWWANQESGREGRGRHKRVDVLLALRKARPEVAHQFNMKRGLLGDVLDASRDQVRKHSRGLLDEDLDPLFRGLGDDHRAVLTHGFKDLATVFAEKGAIDDHSFSCEVPLAERKRLIDSILDRM